MSARALYARGYTDLVSVIPPGATIKPNSRVDPSQRGKCPGRMGAGGWYGYDFTTAGTPTAEAVEAWAHWGANVGLMGEHFPGLDIDSDDPRLTAAVRRFATEHLGPAPARTSRGSRSLLVYRTNAPFGRRALTVEFEGAEHTVEVLGRGRQYLVYGTHPSGRPYGWEGEPLWNVAPESLSLVTLEMVDAFLDALQEALGSKGLTVHRTGANEGADAPPQEDLQGPSPAEVARVVAEIPNGSAFPDRESYIRMGHAIKAAAGGENGLPIFQEWAERWEDGVNDPDTVAADWARMHPPFRVGWPWLLDTAANHGYASARDEFEADPMAADEPMPESPWGSMAVAGVIRFSDEWLVHLIRRRIGDEVRYIPGLGGNGMWLTWNGFKWVLARRLEHEQIVRRTLTSLGQALQALAESMPAKEATPVARAALKCQSRTGITSVLDLLRAHVAVGDGGFDLDPFHLNTPGGVFDLRTGRQIEGDRQYRLATACAPAPGVPHRWLRFLEDLTGGDPAFQDYLQLSMGYTLTGAMSEKVFWFIWGSSSDTGKSTFISVLQGILGDYSSSVDVKAFLSADANRLRPELAQLPGVRLVTATEPATGRVWDEETIKAITGGDTIQTRLLYGQPFTYEPQFKIIVAGNHEPAIRNIDDAMKRRIRIMPFNIKVPEERKVRDLAQQIIREEGPQVLAWLMEGARRWVAEGLETPQVVALKTDAYTQEEDMMAEWISEVCEFDPAYQTPRQLLFEHWSMWMKARNRGPGSIQAFRQEFEDRTAQFEIKESRLKLDGGGHPRGYTGVRIRPRVTLGTEEFTT